MTAGIQDDLRQFVTTLLERRGGLVDWPPEATEGSAVVPGEVAEAVGAPGEMLRLTTSPGGQGWCVNLASDFLETSSRLLEAEPRIGAFTISDLYLKKSNLEEALQRSFHWPNAQVKLDDVKQLPVEYHTWWFRASIASEDRWETRLAVTINAASGVDVDIPDPLELWEIRPRSAPGTDAQLTYEKAAARLVPRVLQQAGDFLGRMDARRQADRRRLQEYYGALLREADKKPRAGTQPDPEKVQAHKRAVDLELRRKLSELDERYAMQVNLEPLVVIETELTAVALELFVRRKRASRRHTIWWNPLLKQLEPMACGQCGANTFTVAFTDEEVAPRCARCAG